MPKILNYIKRVFFDINTFPFWFWLFCFATPVGVSRGVTLGEFGFIGLLNYKH